MRSQAMARSRTIAQLSRHWGKKPRASVARWCLGDQTTRAKPGTGGHTPCTALPPFLRAIHVAFLIPGTVGCPDPGNQWSDPTISPTEQCGHSAQTRVLARGLVRHGCCKSLHRPGGSASRRRLG